jgi:hypothetical protein
MNQLDQPAKTGLIRGDLFLTIKLLTNQTGNLASALVAILCIYILPDFITLRQRYFTSAD